MKILVPMVHNNSELDIANKTMKPLFEVGRKTIIEYVIEKMKEVVDAQFVFVINESDIRNFHLDNVLKRIVPNCEIIIAHGKTRGAACSSLLAIESTKEKESLLVCGIDKFCNTDLNEVIGYFQEKDYDAGVIVFDDINPKWSYVLVEDEKVIEAAEKNPISRDACAGLYYFKASELFFDAVMRMIKKDNSVNGDFYIAPALNELILDNNKLGIYRIEKENFYSLTSEKRIHIFEKFLEGKEA